MGELGGTIHYLYWSDRRVRQVIDDNNIPLRRLGSYTFGASIAGISAQRTNTDRPYSRHEIALSIEKSMGSSAVSSFESPGPVRLAKGNGTVMFGEFVGTSGESLDTASVFTSTQGTDGTRTAICLFGSMTNFTDYVQGGAATSRKGWRSSAAPYIQEFLKKECRAKVEFMSRAELASAALDVILKQGTHQGFGGDHRRARLPWNRGFTYGDVQGEAEWCAQVYYDVLVQEASEYLDDWEGFHRVLIGAPLWVRTPRLRALRIYREYDPRELDREAGFGTVDTHDHPDRQARPKSVDEDRPNAAGVRGAEIGPVNVAPWPKRMAAWAIDLIIAVLVLGTIARSGAAVLGWPDTAGWIGAVMLAFVYWPLTMSSLKRTIGQLITGIQPMPTAMSPSIRRS